MRNPMRAGLLRRGSGLLLLLALLSMLLFLPSSGAFGESGTDAQPQPLVQDDADLLTEAEEAALAEAMRPVCAYGAPMFWTTVESGDYEVLARNFLHRRIANGESGTLFVINMKARQLTIYSDGEIYRVVTDGEAETITDNVYRLAGRGQYYECACSVFGQIAALMEGEQIARPMKTASNALLALVLALLGVYLYVSHRYENRSGAGKARGALPVTAAAAAVFAATTVNNRAMMTHQKKTNISSNSHGGHGGHGGGFSGGGGHSGGGGSHGF